MSIVYIAPNPAPVIGPANTAAGLLMDARNFCAQAAAYAYEASGACSSAASVCVNSANQLYSFSASLSAFFAAVHSDDNQSCEVDIKNHLTNIFTALDSSVEFADDNGLFDAISTIQAIWQASQCGCIIELSDDGLYYIVKGVPGLRNGSALKDFPISKIKGTRYKIGTEAFDKAELWRYFTKGSKHTFGEYAGRFGKNFVKGMQSEFSSFGKVLKDTYGFAGKSGIQKVGTAVGYLGVALDVGTGIYENIQQGASAKEVAADALSDTVVGLGGMAAAVVGAKVGAAIGTAIPVPVVGTVVGAVAGFALGMGASWLYEQATENWKIGGKTVAEHISTGVEFLIDSAGTAVNAVADAVGGFVTNVGSTIAGWFGW